MAKPTKVDLVGVGLNATDTVIPLSIYPARGSKVEYSSSTVLPGGQVATTVVACQHWGLRRRTDRRSVRWYECSGIGRESRACGGCGGSRRARGGRLRFGCRDRSGRLIFLLFLRGLCGQRLVVRRERHGGAGSRSARLVRDWLARLRGWRLLLRCGRSRGLRSRGRWLGRFQRRRRLRLGRRGGLERLGA